MADRMEYTVVPITGQNGRAERFARETTELLNGMADEGWRLVTVDMFWGYLERAARD